MSDQPTQQPTEQEIMAMIAQLRKAPVRDIIIQGLGLMVSGAEAKIGLPDARVLIDVVSAVVDTADGELGDAQEQIKAMVAQLKAAQVQAEQQLAKQGTSASQEGATPDPAPVLQPEKKQTDKLWIPGKQ